MQATKSIQTLVRYAKVLYLSCAKPKPKAHATQTQTQTQIRIPQRIGKEGKRQTPHKNQAEGQRLNPRLKQHTPNHGLCWFITTPR